MNTNIAGRRDPLVDALKGMAILLVMWGHFIQHTLEPNGGDFLSNPVFQWIYMFHMPLFFFLGGYVMAFSLQRRDGLSVLQQRFRSLMIPFFFWSLAAALATYALGATGDRNQALPSLPLHVLNLVVLHPRVWFLVTFFLVSGVLILTLRFSGRFGPAGLGIAYAVLLLLPLNQYGAIYCVQWFFPFFAVGYLASQYQVMTRKFPGKAIVVLVALGSFVLLAVSWRVNDYIYVNKMEFPAGDWWGNSLRMVCRYAAGFAGIIVTWACGLALGGTRLQEELRRIGSYALDIYMLQSGWLEGAYPLLVKKAHLFSDARSNTVLMVLAPAAAIALAYACMGISAQVLRRNPLLLSLLVGGRTGGAAESIAPFAATRP